MKIKKIVSMILAVAMSASLVACGSSSSSTAASSKAASSTAASSAAASSTAASSSHKAVTLKINIVQNDWLSSWDTMKAKFEKEYPWITLESVGVGESGDEFLTKSKANNDFPDVMQVDNNDTCRALVDAGYLADLSKRDVASQIPQTYLDSFTYNGKVFGITQGAAFTCMYYNMKILNDAGWKTVPTNWDELIKCCVDVKAKGYDVMCVAAGKTTSCWFPLEEIIANVCAESLGGMGKYEDAIMNGTFDFTKYPEIATRLDQLAPYLMTGVSSMSEDDVTATMSDGNCAMALAGNWTANNICSGLETATGSADLVKVSLAPFNDKGKDVWMSASPETAFGLSAVKVDDDRAAARELFFDWVFKPENFAIIQNARGTVPVLKNMTSAQIKLPAAVSAIVTDMNKASFVKMSFNLLTSTFYDASCVTLRSLFGGTMKGADVCSSLTTALKADYVNKK